MKNLLSTAVCLVLMTSKQNLQKECISSYTYCNVKLTGDPSFLYKQI